MRLRFGVFSSQGNIVVHVYGNNETRSEKELHKIGRPDFLKHMPILSEKIVPAELECPRDDNLTNGRRRNAQVFELAVLPSLDAISKGRVFCFSAALATS